MLARRPYDLRHACLSTWLNAGVPPAQVGGVGRPQRRSAAAGVRQLRGGDDEVALQRIEEALMTGLA